MSAKSKKLYVGIATQLDRNSAKRTEAEFRDLLKGLSATSLTVKFDSKDQSFIKLQDNIKRTIELMGSMSHQFVAGDTELLRFNKDLRDSGAQIQFGRTFNENMVSVLKMLDRVSLAFKQFDNSGTVQLDTRISGFNTFLTMLAGAAPSTEAFNKSLSSIAKNGGVVQILRDISHQLDKISEKLKVENFRSIDEITKDISKWDSALKTSESNLDQYRKKLLETFGGEAETEVQSLENQIKSLSTYFESAQGSKMLQKAFKGTLSLEDPGLAKFGKYLSAAFALPEENLKQMTVEINGVKRSLYELKEINPFDNLVRSIEGSANQAIKIQNRLKEITKEQKALETQTGKEAYDRSATLTKEAENLTSQLKSLKSVQKVYDSFGGSYASGINKATTELQKLDKEQKEVIDYSSRGLSINPTSIEEFSKAIATAVSSIGTLNASIGEGATLGFKPEQIQAVTTAFENLRQIITDIYNLLSKSDIFAANSHISVGEIEKINSALTQTETEIINAGKSMQNAFDASLRADGGSALDLLNQLHNGVSATEELKNAQTQYNQAVSEGATAVKAEETALQKMADIAFKRDFNLGNSFNNATRSGVKDFVSGLAADESAKATVNYVRELEDSLRRAGNEAETTGQKLQKIDITSSQKDDGYALDTLNQLNEEIQEQIELENQRRIASRMTEEEAQIDLAERIRAEKEYQEVLKKEQSTRKQQETAAERESKKVIADIEKIRQAVSKYQIDSANGKYGASGQNAIAMFSRNFKQFENELATGGMTISNAIDKVFNLKLKLNELAETTKKETFVPTKQIQDFIRQAEYFKLGNKGLTPSTVQSVDEIINLAKAGKITNAEFAKLSSRLNEVKLKAKETGQTGRTWMEGWKKRVSSLTQYLTTFVSFYRITDYIRSSLATIQSLDDALIDLRKTTTMTSEELERFYYDSANVGKEMGTTAQEIINQAAAWSRLGYSSNEAATEMAALSSKFAAISPGMDLDTATDGLVSTMKAFHIDVENVEREVMDSINRIGNTMATSNEEVVEMLTRSSAAMNAANNSLAETIALESAAVQITRNAETTGTAFRTISMRIRGLDEETEEALEDFDMLQGKIADLTKTAKTPGGVSLFRDKAKTEYKSTYELLKDISAIYHDLTDKEQAGLLETLAGKRGGQVLAGVLDNFSEVERAMGEIEKSAGSAEDEMAIIRESISYQLNALKQTWVGFIQDLIDRGVIKNLLENLTLLSEKIIQLAETNPTGLAVGFYAIAKAVKSIVSGNVIKDLSLIIRLFSNKTRSSLLASTFAPLTQTFGELKNVRQGLEVVDDLDDELEGLGHVVSTAGGEAITASKGIKSVGQTASEAVSGVSKLSAAFSALLPLLVAVGAGYLLYKAWDELTVTVSEAEDELSAVGDTLKDIKSQIEELESLDYRTAAQEKRLQNLREELELEERIYAVKQRQLIQEKYGSKFSDFTDENNYRAKLLQDTNGSNKGSSNSLLVFNEQQAENIAKVNEEIRLYTDGIENLKKQISEGTIGEGIGEIQIAELNSKIDEAQKKLKGLQTEQEDTQADIAAKIVDYSQAISDMESDLEYMKSDENGLFTDEDIREVEKTISLYENQLERLRKANGNFAAESGKDYSSAIQEVFGRAEFQGLEDKLVNMGKEGSLSIQYLTDNFGSLLKIMGLTTDQADVLYAYLMNIADPLRNEKKALAEQIGGQLRASTNSRGNKSGLSIATNTRQIQEYLDSLTDEQFTLVSSLDIDFTNWRPDQVIARLQRELDNAGALNIEVNAESDIITSVSNINTKLKAQFDELESAYTAIFHGDDGFDLEVVDVELMEGIRSSFRDLGEDIGVSFEEGDIAVNKFLDTITSAETKAMDLASQQEVTQEAFNELATAYFYSAEGLADLNDETADAIEQQLEQMGVTNATEVVTKSLADAKNIEAAETALASGKSYENVNALLTEANASEYAKIAAFQLAVQMNVLSNTDLNLSQKIEEVNRLASSFLSAANAAKVAAFSAQLESKIRVGDIDGDPSQMLNDYINGLENELDYEKIKVDVEWPGGGTGSSGAGSAGKEAGESFKDAFDEELSKLKESYDRGEITLAQYLAQYRALIDKYFADTEANAEDRAQALHDYLEEMKGYYDSAISGVTTLIDYRISAVQKQKDAAISALEEERDAALKVYDDQIEAIDKTIKEKQKQIKSIEKQKKALEKLKKPLQDEIDAIKDASEARERDLQLQKDLYELEKLQNQRTQFIYKDGQMVYQTDPDAIRDQREAVQKDEDEQKIAALEKQIEAYDKQIEALDEQIELINEEIDSLNEQKEILEEQRAEVEEFYNKLIEDTTKYFDDLISRLEETKEKWERLAEIDKIASAWKDVGGVMEMLGFTVEDVLNDTPGAFEAFEQAYIAALSGMNGENDQYLQGLSQITGKTVEELRVMGDGVLGITDTAKQPLEDLSSSIEDVGTKATGASSGVSGLQGDTDSLATSATNAADSLTTASDKISDLSSHSTELDGVKFALEEIQKSLDLVSKTDLSNVTTNLSTIVNQITGITNVLTTLVPYLDRIDGIDISQLALDFSTLATNVGQVASALVGTGTTDVATSFERIQNVHLSALGGELIIVSEQLLKCATALGGGESGVGLADSMERIGSVEVANNVGLLATNFQTLAENLQLCANILMGGAEDATGGMVQAIQSLNEITLGAEGEGIIGQFLALKQAIDDVTTALGGGTGGESEGAGATTGGAQASGGSGGGAEASGGTGSGGLVGAIEAVKQAADTNIGTGGGEEGGGSGEEEGGGTAISDFEALKTSVDDVSTAIGNSESEEDSADLIGSLTALGIKNNEVLMGGDEGTGVISEWTEFNGQLAEAEGHITQMVEGLENLADSYETSLTVTLSIEGGAEFTGTATRGNRRGSYSLNILDAIGLPGEGGEWESKLGHGHFKGTALFSGTANLGGDWAYEGGSTLIGEIGPELVVFPDGHFETFDYPQFVNLPKGSVIFNHLQTDEILDTKNQVRHLSRGNANLNGSLPSNFTPLSQSNPEQFNQLVQATEMLKQNTSDMKVDLSNIGYATDDIARAVQNITNTNNMGATITFGDLQFTCTGITSAEVMNEVGNALQREFSGLALNAYQRAVNMA